MHVTVAPGANEAGVPGQVTVALLSVTAYGAKSVA